MASGQEDKRRQEGQEEARGARGGTGWHGDTSWFGRKKRVRRSSGDAAANIQESMRRRRESWAIKSRTELTLGELPLVRTRSQAPCASIFLKFMRDSPE